MIYDPCRLYLATTYYFPGATAIFYVICGQLSAVDFALFIKNIVSGQSPEQNGFKPVTLCVRSVSRNQYSGRHLQPTIKKKGHMGKRNSV